MRKLPLESLTGHEWIEHVFHWTALGIEYIGVGIIVIGAIISTILFIYRYIKEKSLDKCYQKYRSNFGRAILLGLEFLIASDIVNTVAIGLTFKDLGVLGLLILIRTFLSFALEVEINGHWPWKASEMTMRSVPK